jgi:preprotein translocase subunit SecD
MVTDRNIHQITTRPNRISGEAEILFGLDKEGTENWAKITRAASHDKRSIAIVIN